MPASGAYEDMSLTVTAACAPAGDLRRQLALDVAELRAGCRRRSMPVGHNYA